jgi:hypothetical protein
MLPLVIKVAVSVILAPLRCNLCTEDAKVLKLRALMEDSLFKLFLNSMLIL